MNRKKEAIVEFAKELFLTPNEQGKHRYSLRDITDEIKQKLNKSLTRTTILNWSRKYGWDKLWEEGVREGITEVLAKEQSEKTKEEQFKEAIANKKQQDFTMSTNLKVLAYKFIKEHKFTTIYEALRAFDTGMKYTQDIQEEIPEKNAINIIVNSEKARELTDRILKGKNADKND